MLRRFLYLDADLVSEFLAQVEGGTFAEEEQHDRARRDRGIRGGVTASAGGIGVDAGGTRGSGSEAETSRVLKQNPESEFARLYDGLSATNDVQWLETLDDEIWSQLRRGEIIEVESNVAVSAVMTFANLAEQVEPLAEAMEVFGGGLDEDAKEAMEGMRALGTLFGKRVPIIARAAGSPRFKLISNLEREKLRVDFDELEGEATLVGKLQRKLAASEKYTVFESMTGLGSLPRALRRSLQHDVKNDPDVPDLVVRAPAAIVTPIAIYR